MTNFSDSVIVWWDQHGRKDLPWQKNKSRYSVWISEIMLQQTQVTTVIPYFQRFIRKFPDVVTLANATQDQVLHLWTGLGYYARARNLHKAAQTIRDEYDGQFPKDFNDVMSLSGIGRSTAAAILSLADDQPYVIMDGNVKRVLSRHRAIEGWPGNKRVENQLWTLAESLKPSERFGDYTQAMMDLGATLCKRSKPHCDVCPVQLTCVSYAQGRQSEFPQSKPKKEKPTKYTTMLILNYSNSVLLKLRPSTGIWGGLYGFIESHFEEKEQHFDDSDLVSMVPIKYREQVFTKLELPCFRHTFSHFHLEITPIVLEFEQLKSNIVSESGEIWFDLMFPSDVGLSASAVKIIEAIKKQRLLPYQDQRETE